MPRHTSALAGSPASRDLIVTNPYFDDDHGRKRGKLRFITEVPLDVLFEIFGQLLPLDLLHISRASKSLRNILLRNSSAFIWREAFANITGPTPPPCPNDLNEPHFVTGRPLWFFGNFLYVHANTVSSRTRRKRKSVLLTSELDAIRKRLAALNDHAEFAQQCREIQETKALFAVICRGWETRLRSYRKQELVNAGKSRENAILEKLNGLAIGWDEELFFPGTKNKLRNLPAVKQKKELTARAFLRKSKKERLYKDRLAVLKSRMDLSLRPILDALPISNDRPLMVSNDVSYMPEYRALMERPSNIQVTKEDFLNLLAHLPEQMEDSKLENSPQRSLELCTTFFRCHTCTEPIAYPRILSHACLNELPPNNDDEEAVPHEDILLRRVFVHTPWVLGHKGVKFHPEASNITAALVTLCVGDPKTMTTAMMDEIDPRFECVRCFHPKEGRLVMKWRIAAS
ncbi:hypothetical protein B0H16DRAFT_1450572 [Mycena metata]|uniref:F-box domain-containing protein n=1 Tax=Mycena metata TaxID=1033252 RepID=A0AAD7JZJ9_9AGAR|nr:hypothetical protein B0H16DRAFT_1450572 [Mycena metata]